MSPRTPCRTTTGRPRHCPSSPWPRASSCSPRSTARCGCAACCCSGSASRWAPWRPPAGGGCPAGISSRSPPCAEGALTEEAVVHWVWQELVRDPRLPSPWDRWLDNAPGWRLRRYVSPLQPLAWLATGTPPSRIGYAPGPLTALRRRRHRRAFKPIRVCLLEGPVRGASFSPVTAYWINEHSRVAHAVVDDAPERADVVWVHTQGPVPTDVRSRLQESLLRV